MSLPGAFRCVVSSYTCWPPVRPQDIKIQTPPPLPPLPTSHTHAGVVPVQEGKLLSGLVNKLGDPSRKIASKAGYLLSSLLQEHPAMKVVVVAEVQRFMFRQGLQERARYYGVVFLNQMVLSHNASQGGVHKILRIDKRACWTLLQLCVAA